MLVYLVKLAPEEVLVLREAKVLEESLASPDAMDCLDPLVKMAPPARMVRTVFLDLAASLARQVKKGPREGLVTTSKANSKFT